MYSGSYQQPPVFLIFVRNVHFLYVMNVEQKKVDVLNHVTVTTLNTKYSK
jgi:hypothetical protein